MSTLHPTRAELEAERACPTCGGLPLDLSDMGHDAGIGDKWCDCEEAAEDVALRGTYSPERDTREWFDDENPALPGKRVA